MRVAEGLNFQGGKKKSGTPNRNLGNATLYDMTRTIIPFALSEFFHFFFRVRTTDTVNDVLKLCKNHKIGTEILLFVKSFVSIQVFLALYLYMGVCCTGAGTGGRRTRPREAGAGVGHARQDPGHSRRHGPRGGAL
jgi:hypothetical protein